MSYYFRDTPRFADRLRGKSGDELLREMKQRFNENNDTLFEPTDRHSRDPFERHTSAFSRGFPFDDEEDGFGRRGDGGIRAHLDNLASRHPDLADHLLGPPWGDAPFHGSSLLRGRRRRRDSGGSGSGSGSGSHQAHQVDEDARSQTSSGSSAVSSHSGDQPDSTATPTSSSIPHYGLRNTVDIGQQQRRDMENQDKSERGQRSMSAPPENRQQQQQSEQLRQPQQQQQQQPSQPGQGQRFVSRVEITPQHNQQQQRAQSPKTTSNVRHIPIFVEGRDEPVISKVADDTPPSGFQRQPSPPHFHRPSHFNDHFARQQWPPSHFQNAFYEPGFDQPTRRHQQQQPQYQQPQYQQPQNQQPQYKQPQYQQPQYQQPQYQQPQYQQQPQQQQPQQQQQQQQQQEIPKPKPPAPKDPLEKVAQVQKDVDDLAEQVRLYVGGSRRDKDYVYLDEMLTRELIKLDDIETEGRENVRQARKNAIKSIQDTISLLETKAPLAGQQELSRAVSDRQQEKAPQTESMEVDTEQENRERQSNEPIPLPPAPSSPTKKDESSENGTTAVESANQATPAEQNTDVPDERKIENPEQLAAATSDEPLRAESTTEESSDRKSVERKNAANDVTRATENDTMPLRQAAAVETGKTEGQDRSESPRLQKKTKKKQQQQPVSEQAIPLPPPPPMTGSAK